MECNGLEQILCCMIYIENRTLSQLLSKEESGVFNEYWMIEQSRCSGHAWGKKLRSRPGKRWMESVDKDLGKLKES